MLGKKVLDSTAIVAFLEDANGADQIGELIKRARDSDKPLFINAVAWGEVYISLCQFAGAKIAEQAALVLETLPIQIIPVDKELAIQAAAIALTSKIKFCDCLTVALAKSKRATLVTGNIALKEMTNIVDILWIQGK